MCVAAGSVLCREESIAEARRQVEQQLGGAGGLSVLVNNAGVGLVAPAE